MDNNQSAIPTQPGVPQPISPEAPQPASGGSNTLLFVVGALFFLSLLGGMGYYIMQPQGGSEDSIAQAPTPSPTPTAVAQTAEEQDVEAAVSYSLDDSFAELERDLQEL